MEGEGLPPAVELSVVVRFAPGATEEAVRGVAFRIETGQRLHFSSFAELELVLRELVAATPELVEEQISAQ